MQRLAARAQIIGARTTKVGRSWAFTSFIPTRLTGLPDRTNRVRRRGTSPN